MRIRDIFDLRYSNDLVLTDKEIIVTKINTNANFSFSFLVLLVSSSIICTLGLLLNSAPVVIGGMIISPLMWPLVKQQLAFLMKIPDISDKLLFCLSLQLLLHSQVLHS